MINQFLILTSVSILTISCNHTNDSQKPIKEQVAHIDPTGTYKLDHTKEDENGEVYGYSGQIQIKAITNNKIVMTFIVNKGAPSYNSGSFVDTLTYNNNIALYKAPNDIDSTCTITFHFDKEGVQVNEETENLSSGCGFGYGVIAKGFFQRISSNSPILNEPLTGEKLEN